MGMLIKARVSKSGGCVPLPLTDVREIVANATVNAAGIGGHLASDTTPALVRTNGATDKCMRLQWVASNVDEIQWEIVAPSDMDTAYPVNVILFAGMSGATDTPTVAVNFFVGVGGTNVGASTTALSSTNTAYTVAVAAGSAGNPGDPWNISLIPGAHGTDALRLYSARVEYTRK